MMLSAPNEATAFLGLVAICMAFLLVFYLYLAKKSCFNSIGGLLCCDKTPQIEKEHDSNVSETENLVEEEEVQKNIGNSFPCEVEEVEGEEEESTTNSEDELLQKLLRSNHSFNNNKHPKQVNHANHTRVETNYNHRNINMLKNRQRSFDAPSKTSMKHNASMRPLLLRSESTPESRASINGVKMVANGSADLISLAEKGRIGRGGSSGGSCSSEACSADIEEDSQSSILRERKISVAAKMSRLRKNGALYEEVLRSHYNNFSYEKCESDGMSSHSQELSSSLPVQSSLSNHFTSKHGSLEISYAYDAPTKKLLVTVVQAQEIPYKEKGGANQVQVRFILLPHKRQKQKTKVRPNGSITLFNETFTFNRINPEDIMKMGIRFRVYGTSFAKKEHLIGEASIAFAYMKPIQQATKALLCLEARSNLSKSDSRSEASSLARSDSTGSTQSMAHASSPELLIGLSYNGTTGRLSVIVIKGSQFRNSVTRAPDTYIKLSLVSSSGQEIARSKSSVRKGQPNPLFK